MIETGTKGPLDMMFPMEPALLEATNARHIAGGDALSFRRHDNSMETSEMES